MQTIVYFSKIEKIQIGTAALPLISIPMKKQTDVFICD